MDELYHIGKSKLDGAPIGSGRFPLGSGENPYQREPRTFLDRIDKFRDDYKKEFGRKPTDKEIADALQMTVKELQSRRAVARVAAREGRRQEALRLQAELGNKYSEIGRRMGGLNESSVRSLLKPVEEQRNLELMTTMDMLERAVADKKYVDVGKGVNASMHISRDRLDKAVQALKDKGYEVHNIYIPQLGGAGDKQNTTAKILCAPGVDMGEVLANKTQIGEVVEHFKDPHATEPWKLGPIQSIDSSKISVVYGPEGEAKDGLIELRRGADGLDMGMSRYAQVRIGVDGTHYIKGMAIYSDDLPKGTDILVYSNKKEGTPLLSSDPDAKQVLKPMKYNDEANPFGAQIKFEGQHGYLNLVNEEGDWDTWSKNLASQMLSKQSTVLAKQQLNLAKQDRQYEFQEIRALSNPVLREEMLLQFADKCDRAATNLKAKAMPGQSTHVLLPMSSVKPTEIYAPNFENGTKVVLIRYPHGGTFEIPELTVNNKNKEASKIFQGRPPVDAVGIHHSVASQLSGADFDGDTVLVIPNDDKRIQHRPARSELQEFNPKTEYPAYPGMKRIREDEKQKQMGVVSNLITDMTLQKAPIDDVIKAVRHSMVVIDSEKHNLNWKASERDHEIEALKRKYQMHDDGTYGGASTIISRASAKERVPERKRSYRPDPETGLYTYTETGKTHVNKKGEVVPNISKVPRMQLTNDARTLVSANGGTVMERIYADYANQMKSYAAQARKEAVSIPTVPRNPEMTKLYSKEVASLKDKVREVYEHRPLERRALFLANEKYAAQVRANPGMDDDHKKRLKNRCKAEARAQVGSKRPEFNISDKEWEAIQKGAVSKTTQKEVFRYANQEDLKRRALPKQATTLTPAKLQAARSRLRQGYTYADIAKSLGVSVSTLKSAMTPE